MNRVMLMGRLTADPGMRTTPSNNVVVTFSIAVQRRFAQEGQQQADFVNCVAWNKTGEFINKWFSKGRLIAVEGRLQSRSWEENGVKRYAVDVVVENAFFTGEKKEEMAEPATAPIDDFCAIGTADESDLPF